MKDGEPIDTLSAFSDRERTHHLIPPAEIQEKGVLVKKLMAGPYADLDAFLQNPGKTSEALKTIKQSVLLEGAVPDARELCSDFISLAFSNTAYSIAICALEKEKFASFAFWFDVTFGMSYIGRISAAQDFQTGEIEQIALDSVTRVSEVFPKGVDDEVNTYLRLMRDAQEANALLHADPTGFLIIDDQVEKLKKDPLAVIGRDWQIPEFVIAGAEFAQKAYKGIYPLAKACLTN